MEKIFEIDYELAENIFENSDKNWNKTNLKLHKCSDKTPSGPGVYLAYEQYDLDDQYLVVWTGKKWIHFEYGGDIGFGDSSREDHWSELPNELPRYIKTATNMASQLQDSINYIVYNNPEMYYKLDRKEIISQQTETAFRVFQKSLNSDISKVKSSV